MQENEKKPIEGDAASETDWDSRTLCSDESCIGVIGADGCCKECGKIYEGSTPEGGFDKGTEAADTETAVKEPEAETEVDTEVDTEAAEEGDSASGDEWDNRRLCSDESCIGVIGPDGRCKECGKPS
jgi:hypothetical protein